MSPDVSKRLDKKISKELESIAKFLTSSEKKTEKLIVNHAKKCIELVGDLGPRDRAHYSEFFSELVSDTLLFCREQHAKYYKKYRSKVEEAKEKKKAGILTKDTLGNLLDQAIDYKMFANDFDNQKFLIEGFTSQFEMWFVQGNTDYLLNVTRDWENMQAIRTRERERREILGEIMTRTDKEIARMEQEVGLTDLEDEELAELLKDDVDELEELRG
ncbi:MAG: hypothetical protein GNW80_01725 [Asgard group archaeon]|nr:hypothetical protein [Asgard group archaeon]